MHLLRFLFFAFLSIAAIPESILNFPLAIQPSSSTKGYLLHGIPNLDTTLPKMSPIDDVVIAALRGQKPFPESSFRLQQRGKYLHPVSNFGYSFIGHSASPSYEQTTLRTNVVAPKMSNWQVSGLTQASLENMEQNGEPKDIDTA